MDGLKSVGAGSRQGHVGPIIKFEVILVENSGAGWGIRTKDLILPARIVVVFAEGRVRFGETGRRAEELGFSLTLTRVGGNSTVYLLCTFYPNALSTVFLLRSQSRGVFEFLLILR
ncbi:hypothetical protein PVL29_015432 [Vitis rotundifolia]|uniref:Uncharacterized protein n=1 Tax=Vitis rotundifolia TaxID=103349 RepID=A0AA38ZDJ5_VITRO|nr:hypothetical protein PVL29_015432 [Vitis rotundifolia]